MSNYHYLKKKWNQNCPLFEIGSTEQGHLLATRLLFGRAGPGRAGQVEGLSPAVTLSSLQALWGDCTRAETPPVMSGDELPAVPR